MIEETNNDRKVYVDIAKGLGILLVLLGHLLPIGSIVKSAIYAFHMPLFFFLSGAVFKQMPVKNFFIKRWSQILSPYFLWALIFSSFSFKNCAYILYGTNETLLAAKSNGMLWFLTTMFAASLLMNWILTYIKNKRLRYAIIVVLIITSVLLRYLKLHTPFFERYGLPFAIDIICLASAFMLFGKLLLSFIQDRTRKLKHYSVFLIGIIMLSFSLLGHLMPTAQGYLQMATLDVGNIYIYYIIAVISVVGVIFISKVVELSNILSRGLSWLGRNTLLIFIVHRIFLYNIKDIYDANPNIVTLLLCYVAHVLSCFHDCYRQYISCAGG